MRLRLLKKAAAYVCAFSMLAGIAAMSPADAETAYAKGKLKLAKKTYSVTVGKTAKIKVKNGNKKAKVTWKSSKPKIVKISKKKNGKNAYAKVKALKKGNAKVTATYKLGKTKKKLKCTVKAVSKKKVTVNPTAVPTAVPTNNVVPAPVPTPTPEPFTIINNKKADVKMYIDANDSEYDGISLIADAFKADVARVIGVGTDAEGAANESPDGLSVVTDKSALSGKAVIAGTFGNGGNDVINSLISEGKLDVSAIQGKWECYKLQVVKNPLPGVSEALVIAGSDKRGTIYGIFRISELMGVSPWVWWADAAPAVRDRVDLPGIEINTTSKEPSVKYRGIFLNDEAPSLTSWTDARYGGRNQYFYKQVYELILRLKGDYLWPAMWGDTFNKGGKGEDKLANAKLADQYGIVMGTSHHEPLYRAGNEWGQEYGSYKGSLNISSANAWNQYNIPDEDGYNEKINTAIEAFWTDGVARNKEFENICTVGMRGEADSSLPAANNPPKYADLLNYIINVQKGILADAGDSNPTQLVIYKEVEDAWNKGELYNQDCMRDTIAMFCDDNFAYLRTLPTYDQQQMVGGLGMYYHFDYVGGPKSYTWIQTSQLSKIWDQMSVAYDYNIDDVWIVNVGDLKPMEMDISYFLDLGYDFDKWGVDGNSKLSAYKANWIKQQLGMSGNGLNDEQLAEAMQLISDYLDLETSRKVEHVLACTESTCSDMYSASNYYEAQELLMKCNDIMERAERLKSQVPQELQAAFYQLVYYPAMSVPNVLKISIYVALNNKYGKNGFTVANTYTDLFNEAIELDAKLYDDYNNNMPGAPEDGKKWKGMQSADWNYHFNMTGWETNSGIKPLTYDAYNKMTQKEKDDAKNRLKKNYEYSPRYYDVKPEGEASLNGLLEDVTGAFDTVYTSGEASLPAFTNINNEVYTIELVNKSSASYNYTAAASADWIKLSKTSGTVTSMDAIQVSIDWSKVTANASGNVTVSDGTNTVTVAVNADVVNVTGFDANTYVMANDYATIDVSRYTAIANGSGFANDGSHISNKMLVVPDNGKYLTSVRTSSSTITYGSEADLAEAPYIEYKVYVPEAGSYNIQCQFNPTSNVEYGNAQLRYGISVDGGPVTIQNSINDNYLAGSYSSTWAADIENNSRKSTISDVNLTAGVHTIRYYQCDPNMALIRIVVHSGSLASVYGAPAESYYVGKSSDAAARIEKKQNMYSAVVK